MVTLKLSYYPDITQKQSENDIRDAVIVFANALAMQLSRNLGNDVSIETLPVMSVADQYRDILAGGHHIALMKPVAYVLAHRQRPGIVPACVAYRPIDGIVGPTYFAQIYARRELGITTLEELARRNPATLRIAYGDRFSTSNFLIPANILSKAGIHPFLFFKSVEFFGGHDLVAEAVYRGDADIGGGHDGVIKILTQTEPDAESELVALGRENIHSDPVVVNTDVLPREIRLEAIQEAAIAVAKTVQVQAALDLFWGWVKDLGPTNHTNYASIEQALERLSLGDAEMLN